MTSAFFGVSDIPWCLCQPIISFWPAPWCFKLTTSFVNCPEPVVGARVCTQMTIIENSQSTIHLLQKGTSWAYWDPLRPSLDGFHRIVGFFVIHQLFLWPLIPLVSFCQLFKSPLVVQYCNVICEWPHIILQRVGSAPRWLQPTKLWKCNKGEIEPDLLSSDLHVCLAVTKIVVVVDTVTAAGHPIL